MSDLYKIYRAERMREYRARRKAVRPVIVKVKKQPMSVKERVRLYRERKRQLQKSQSLDRYVSGDEVCLGSENVQTGIVGAKPEKKPPMSSKERVRLYRQRQKEIWEKYQASNVSLPSVSADSQCLNSTNAQTRTVTVKLVKKQPISVRERVSLYRERKKQLQENQILDLSVSAASRSVEKQVTLDTQNSKKLHLKMYPAPFPFFFFERLMEVDKADSQNRSDINSESVNMNTHNSINQDENDCKEDNRLQNKVTNSEDCADNNEKQKNYLSSVPIRESIKLEYVEQNLPIIKEEEEDAYSEVTNSEDCADNNEKQKNYLSSVPIRKSIKLEYVEQNLPIIKEEEEDAYSEIDDDESTIVTDYCKLVMEDAENLDGSKSFENHSSDEDSIENEVENVDRLSFSKGNAYKRW